jgi:hypothetical protein
MNRRKLKHLYRLIRPRIDALPPYFTGEIKEALGSAELMFRYQGGCPPVATVLTTEDGEFLSPLPDGPMNNQQIDERLWDVLLAKPGARAVYTCYTSTPEGGGCSANRMGRLYCRCVTMERLYKLHALISKHRTLAPWVCEICFAQAQDRPNQYPFVRTWPEMDEHDIVLVGDAQHPHRPHEQMYRGGTLLSVIRAKIGAEDILEDANAYLWASQLKNEQKGDEFTMSIVLPGCPYYVSHVDMVSLSEKPGTEQFRAAKSQAEIDACIAGGTAPYIIAVNWADWLKLAPMVGRVLDPEAVLVNEQPLEVWQEMWQSARKVCVFDTEVGPRAGRK